MQILPLQLFLQEPFLKVRCEHLMVELVPIGSMCHRHCQQELGYHSFSRFMVEEVVAAASKATVATTAWLNPMGLLSPTQTERARAVRTNFNWSGTEASVVGQQLNVTSMTLSSSDSCSTS
jgi:hypothetical protein